MTRIANNFWIGTYGDYAELKELYDNGCRLNSGLEFSHHLKDDGKTYYCFRPTDRRVDGSIYATEYMIADVFKLLNATVSCKVENNTVTFDGISIVINHGKTIKYKFDDEFSYALQKTQYKGSNPYGLLEMLVNEFWGKQTSREFKQMYL